MTISDEVIEVDPPQLTDFVVALGSRAKGNVVVLTSATFNEQAAKSDAAIQLDNTDPDVMGY